MNFSQLFVGIDLVIGAPLEMEHRIARLAASPKLTIAREIVEYPIILRLVWNMISAQASRKSLLGKVSQNVPWMANVRNRALICSE